MLRRLTERWWWVSAALVAAVVAVAAVTAHAVREHRDAQSATGAHNAVASLRASVTGVLAEERALGHVLGSLHTPIGSRWPTFAQTVLSEPLAQSVGFVQPVTGRDRVRFERRAGLRIIRYVRPGVYAAAPRDARYLVLRYLVQRIRLDLRTGIDLDASPVRRALLIRSARTGRELASAPVPLLTTQQGRGVVIYVAVRDRRGHLRGWVSAVYAAGPLAESVERPMPGLRLTIADGHHVLVDDGAARSVRPARIEVAGRTWTVWATPAATGSSATPWLVLGLGLALAAFVSLVLRQSATRERYASGLVEIHVAAERVRQAELAEERRALAAAQAIANVGSWSLDPASGALEWSEQMYRIFDCDPSRGPLTGPRLVERVEDADRADAVLAYRSALAAGSDFDLRFRLTGDRGVRHVRAMGRREADGHYVGTVQDITQAAEARSQLAAAKVRLQAVLEHAPMGIYLRDLDGRFVVANEQIAAMLGRTPEELVGAAVQDLLGADAGNAIQADDREFARTGKARRLEEHAAVADLGSDGGRHFLWEKFPVRDDTGRVTGVGGIALDITERARTERALRETEERFRRAFEDSPIGMVIVDFDGRLLQVNASLARMLGYTREELEGARAQILESDADPQETRQVMNDLRCGARQAYAAERRYRTVSGELVDCLLHATVLNGPDGRPQAILSQLEDITDRKRHQRQLEHLADHDALTGLPNRRGFTRTLGEHVRVTAGAGARGSLLMIDLDGFKQINDTFGHHAGDAILTDVARRLRERLRGSDIVARWGGDEFIVLLPDTERAGAETVAAGLSLELALAAVEIEGDCLGVGASIGVTSFAEENASSAEEAIARADRAMYAVKARPL